MGLPHANPEGRANAAVLVAGVQREDPLPEEVIADLEAARAKAPDAHFFVLSEYTYQTSPPPELLDWCRRNSRHVLVGGIETIRSENLDDQVYNMAYVVDPRGEVIHKQAKCVPIQFMNDGLPARRQRIWNAPQAKVGIAICYDMNYTRVMDALIRKEAELLVIPAMDVKSWGETAHRLSAQLAAVRAAEYGIPLFRLASSGYSRIALPNGRLMAETSMPGQGEVIHGKVFTSGGGRRPLDRWLVWPCLGLTAALVLFLLGDQFRRLRAGRPVID